MFRQQVFINKRLRKIVNIPSLAWQLDKKPQGVVKDY